MCRKEAEDEKHFLVSCPVYQEKKKSLFECLYKEFKIPNEKMSTENIFLLLLTVLTPRPPPPPSLPSNNADLQKIRQLQSIYTIAMKLDKTSRFVGGKVSRNRDAADNL